MPQAPRTQLPFAKLDGRLQRSLRWLNACRLIRRDDLIRLGWPDLSAAEGGPTSRQRISQALQDWIDDHFITPTADGAAFMLGSIGALKLEEVGVTVHVPQEELAARVQPGLLLASEFAIALGLDLLLEPGVTHFTWVARAFSGAGPRADGYGGVWYQRNRQPPPDVSRRDLLDLALPTDDLGAQQLAWLLLEVDMGTETPAQLEERAARWGRKLREQYPRMPPGNWPYVLWVTTGDRDRMQAIWRAWLTAAMCPLLITTVAMLRLGDALHPWRGLWRDEHGRPRYLNPFAGQEPAWRYQESPPPTCATLEQAIRAWEATQRV
jgi:hypothetical protein